MSAIVLATAVISLVIGLAIYFWNVTGRNRAYVNTTNIIAWLLIALTPVLFIFSFFPDSSASGTMFGVSLGGAILAFIVIWVFGVNKSIESAEVDKKVALLDQLQKENQQQKDTIYQLQIAKGVALPSPVIVGSQVLAYKLKARSDKKMALISGDIRNVTRADVWVNSENTNMQMARYYERSISGTIRYLGAKKDRFGNVVDDLIANELKTIMGANQSVQPGTIIVTSAGELQATNNVKRIFHAASVQGQVGAGYKPIDGIEQCVTNGLREVDSDECRNLALKSLLFPLLGVGHAQGDLRTIAGRLLYATVAYLEENPNGSVETVYFLVWTEAERDVCKSILESNDKLELA